jgi:hypothetical protein
MWKAFPVAAKFISSTLTHSLPTDMKLRYDCHVASRIRLQTSPLYHNKAWCWSVAGVSTWKTGTVKYDHNSAVKIKTNPPHESASDGELLDGLSWMGVAVEGCCWAAEWWWIGHGCRCESVRILWCVCACIWSPKFMMMDNPTCFWHNGNGIILHDSNMKMRW